MLSGISNKSTVIKLMKVHISARDTTVIASIQIKLPLNLWGQQWRDQCLRIKGKEICTRQTTSIRRISMGWLLKEWTDNPQVTSKMMPMTDWVQLAILRIFHVCIGKTQRFTRRDWVGHSKMQTKAWRCSLIRMGLPFQLMNQLLKAKQWKLWDQEAVSADGTIPSSE